MFAESLVPGELAAFGVVTGADADVGDDEEMLAAEDGGGDVGGGFDGPPGDGVLLQVAAAGGVDRQDVVIGKAGSDEQEFAVKNGGGDELLGRAVHVPLLFAGAGVVAGDAFAAGHHELRPAGDVADDGGDVAASLVGAGRFPNLFSGRFVEGDQVAVPVVVAVDDDHVLEQHGRTAIAVDAGEAARFDQPLLVTVKVVGGHDHVAGGATLLHFAVHRQEGDIDQFAIGCRRSRGKTVEAVLFLEADFENVFLPDRFARLAVERNQHPVFLIFQAGDDKDSVPPDNRRRMAGAVDFDLPSDVVAGLAVPLGRDVRFGAGAVTLRPTPHRPVRCQADRLFFDVSREQGRGEEQEEGGEDEAGHGGEDGEKEGGRVGEIWRWSYFRHPNCLPY